MARIASFKQVLQVLVREDDEYVLIRHSLEPGRKTRPHYHSEAKEWLVIINDANFDLRVGEEKENFISHLGADEVMVFFIPKGKVHAIKAVTQIEYFVLRDKPDKTIYAK